MTFISNLLLFWLQRLLKVPHGVFLATIADSRYTVNLDFPEPMSQSILQLLNAVKLLKVGILTFAWSMTNSLSVLLSILKLKYRPRYLNSSSILMGGISSFLI